MSLYDWLWGVDFTKPQLRVFSIPHILTLLATAIFILFLIYCKDYVTKRKKIFVYFIGISVLLSQVLMYIWYIDTGWFNIHDSLPLYISRLSSILSAIMIITNSRKLFDILYFWGLFPPAVALMLPDIDYFAFPHIRFWFFFIGHAFTIFAVVYMISIEKMKPNLDSFKKAIKWLMIYCVVAFIFNVFTNSNYGYLMELPHTLKSLEPYLPYPLHIIPLIVIQVLVFYLTYIPFKIKAYKLSTTSN